MKVGILIIIICIGIGIPLQSLATEYESGKIINNVTCTSDPDQSYALYLPLSYSPEKKWPIIYAFDPGAKGVDAVNHFKEAAEKYVYIVVCSNNSRNGPWEPILKAGRAVWRDTQSKFSIDSNRIYSSGFSGGSRVASVFKFISNQDVAGIIACGAGLNTNLKPSMIKNTVYYGIVGLGDFNYSEMMKLNDTLENTGINHHILIFDGGHQWPPMEICTQAVEWMEIQAIKKGTKTKDEDLIQKLFKLSLERALRWETEKNIFFAVSDYEDLIQSFSGLVDVSKPIETLQILKNSREYKQFLKNEKKREKKESDFIKMFGQVFAAIRYSNQADIPGTDVVSRDLKLQYLQKEASRAENYFNRGLAQRLLLGLKTNAFQFGSEFLQKEDNRKAGIFFEIIDRLGADHPVVLYNLACYYSRSKQKKKALQYLKQAMESGFDSLNQINSDKDLDFIRNEPEFKEIIDSFQDQK